MKRIYSISKAICMVFRFCKSIDVRLETSTHKEGRGRREGISKFLVSHEVQRKHREEQIPRSNCRFRSSLQFSDSLLSSRLHHWNNRSEKRRKESKKRENGRRTWRKDKEAKQGIQSSDHVKLNVHFKSMSPERLAMSLS
jgi:hypothetical protein